MGARVSVSRLHILAAVSICTWVCTYICEPSPRFSCRECLYVGACISVSCLHVSAAVFVRGRTCICEPSPRFSRRECLYMRVHVSVSRLRVSAAGSLCVCVRLFLGPCFCRLRCVPHGGLAGCAWPFSPAERPPRHVPQQLLVTFPPTVHACSGFSTSSPTL